MSSSSGRRAVAFGHGSSTGLGLLAPLLRRRGIEVEWHTRARTTSVSSVGASLIISLGSPWSVYDATHESRLVLERRCIEDALANGVPVLGICFGAQLLASMLGGEVHRADHPEVGWAALEVLQGGLDRGPWLNWHHDTFTVPGGATELARSHVGPQAFAGQRYLGLQFHPEVTPRVMRPWLKVGHADLAAVGRSGSSILLETILRYPGARARSRRLLGRFLDACNDAED